MLDVWRVSRIASNDILKSNAATSARSAIAETVRKTVSPFRQFSRRDIIIFVYILFICKLKDQVLVRPDKNVNRRMLIFIEAAKLAILPQEKSCLRGVEILFAWKEFCQGTWRKGGHERERVETTWREQRKGRNKKGVEGGSVKCTMNAMSCTSTRVMSA